MRDGSRREVGDLLSKEECPADYSLQMDKLWHNNMAADISRHRRKRDIMWMKRSMSWFGRSDDSIG